MYFELGTIKVPLESVLNFSQSYSPLSSRASVRMADGTAVVRQNWAKIKTVISGDGWAPAGLDGFDDTAQHVLKCGAPRRVASTALAIVIPSARRTDTGYEPWGYALVNNEQVSTTIASTVSNTVTLTAVTGATQYYVEYFPQITVFAQLAESSGSGDVRSAWRLEAEQV